MARLLHALRSNGLRLTVEQLYYMGETKIGRLVGTDFWGNRYFESNYDIFTKERWVLYGPKGRDDPSSIPAEWHMWLHRMNDDAPSRTEVQHKFFETPHTNNLTGSPQAYVPYSTTTPPMQSWTGKPTAR